MLSRLFDWYPDESLVLYPADFTLLYTVFDPHKLSPNLEATRERTEKALEQSMRHFTGKVLGPGQQPFDYDLFRLGVLDLINDSMLGGNRSDFCESVLEVFLEAVKKVEARTVLVKETSQSVHGLDFLSAGWKIIHLIRDPRDVYAAIHDGIESYYSKNGESDLEILMSVIFRFSADIKSVRAMQTDYPTQVHQLSFESLVEDKELVMRDASAFLNIEFSRELLAPTILGEPFVSNTFGQQKISAGEISAINIGRWRERISLEEKEIIEFFLHYEMVELGLFSEKSPQLRLSVSNFYSRINTLYFFRKKEFHERVLDDFVGGKSAGNTSN